MSNKSTGSTKKRVVNQSRHSNLLGAMGPAEKKAQLQEMLNREYLLREMIVGSRGMPNNPPREVIDSVIPTEHETYTEETTETAAAQEAIPATHAKKGGGIFGVLGKVLSSPLVTLPLGGGTAALALWAAGLLGSAAIPDVKEDDCAEEVETEQDTINLLDNLGVGRGGAAIDTLGG